ncbi:MAG: hypothetical protein Q4G60_09500 [bacterium]|nr:hypothetical protein [bacterium]
MRVANGDNTTLLDYLNKSTSQQSSGNEIIDLIRQHNASNSILNTTGKSGTSSSDSTASDKAKAGYANVIEKTNGLQEEATALLGSTETSLFAKAEASGNTEDVVKSVEAFVSDYNSMLTAMNNQGGEVNKAYAKMMSQYYTENKDALNAVGITQNENGTLSVKEETLKAAPLSSLKSLFGSEKSYLASIKDTSEKIESNAQAYVDYYNGGTYNALKGSYGLSGSLFDSQS